MAHVPGSNASSNVSSQTCNMYLPGKGPQWQHFGWQISQRGAHPSNALGQLISVVNAGTTFVLARSPAATPFRQCGPGSTGWVALATDGTLGCMQAAANCVPWQMCNGFEVAVRTFRFSRFHCHASSTDRPPFVAVLQGVHGLSSLVQRVVPSWAWLSEMPSTAADATATTATTTSAARRGAVHQIRPRDRGTESSGCNDHPGQRVAHL